MPLFHIQRHIPFQFSLDLYFIRIIHGRVGTHLYEIGISLSAPMIHKNMRKLLYHLQGFFSIGTLFFTTKTGAVRSFSCATMIFSSQAIRIRIPASSPLYFQSCQPISSTCTRYLYYIFQPFHLQVLFLILPF